MGRNRSIRKEIIALCGSMIVALMSAAPLFDRHNDAQILTLFAGSFAAGVALNNLVRKLRDKKQKERQE